MELRKTIREITLNHCNNGGMVIGQCLSAVGWVNNTIDPKTKNVIELPMTDVAGSGFACGAAISGIRPILVLRFQDFLLLNGSILVNFAAKLKEISGISAPLWVRAIAQEGNGTGCVHSGKYHSIFSHFPGFNIVCPITSDEYKQCWNDFMKRDVPTICFEHRHTYDNKKEFNDVIKEDSKATVIGVSLARQYLDKVNLPLDKFGVFKLKPLELKVDIVKSLSKTRKGFIIDTGYDTCSIAKEIASQYYMVTRGVAKIYTLGIEDISSGCRKENLTPSTEVIEKFIKERVKDL